MAISPPHPQRPLAQCLAAVEAEQIADAASAVARRRKDGEDKRRARISRGDRGTLRLLPSPTLRPHDG
jgi:hypothetical protein